MSEEAGYSAFPPPLLVESETGDLVAPSIFADDAATFNEDEAVFAGDEALFATEDAAKNTLQAIDSAVIDTTADTVDLDNAASSTYVEQHHASPPFASAEADQTVAIAGAADGFLAASDQPAEEQAEEQQSADAPFFELPERTAAARMVSYAKGKLIAFAPHVTQELIEKPQWVSLPGAAYYAYGLLHWQNRYIPFIHLESVLQAYPAFDATAEVPYALVLAYQDAPSAPLRYGAIAVTETPYSHQVKNSDFTPLPKDSDMWAELAVSCFQYHEQAVPILDAAKIFAAYHG